MTEKERALDSYTRSKDAEYTSSKSMTISIISLIISFSALILSIINYARH